MNKIIKQIPDCMPENLIVEKLNFILQNVAQKPEKKILGQIFSFIDLTSLNSTDTTDKIAKLCNKVNKFSEIYDKNFNVAAICVYPAFVETVKKNLKKENIKIASVTGGFPASQTFIETKINESKIAVQKGADELDMVISVGSFLEGDFEKVYSEIKAIKEECQNAHLKVIIESGALNSAKNIWVASWIAMLAGADFIKTSTGKIQTSATPLAAITMCMAINDFYKKTNKKIGFKPAGGISDSSTAYKYYLIVKEILGDEWLNAGFFRIGASSLANKLLTDIQELNTKYF